MMNVTHPTSPYDTTLDTLYGTLCLLCFLFGTLGNSLSLLYFSRRADLPSFLYTCINWIDLAICISVLPMGVSYLSGRRGFLFEVHVLCNVWGYVFHALTLYSVFYVGFLSVTRAYVLLSPLRKVNKSTVGGISLLHFFAQSLLSSLVFWDGGRYRYSPDFVECSAHTSSGSGYHVVEHVVGMVTYLAPILPILAGSVLTLLKLGSVQELQRSIRSRERVRLSSIYQPFERWLKKDNNGLKLKRDASVTILIFTAVYAIFNIPMAICYVFHIIEMVPGQRNRFFTFDKPGFYFNNLVFNLAIPINSTVNPLIYLTRIKSFRNFLLIYIRKVFLYFRLPIYF